jgi:hypothetical protein
MQNERESGLWDSISKGLGEAVTDIRQKVVEEGMWGRVVTEGQGQEQAAPDAEFSRSFGSSVTQKEVGPQREQWGWPKAEECNSQQHDTDTDHKRGMNR